jgi:exodeoxyribonuclease V gamma subunit
VAAWAQAIGFAADTLTASTPRESWQRAQLQRVLDDLVDEASGTATALATTEVRALLAERLQGRPTRANFRTGHLTVCTLVPMRSVPHRIVCLLGLDDGAFPRKAPRDGDDVMLDAPRVGERDPRSEDRQLLLDALMAAGEQLILTYSGNDERTNAVQPPAVPVGELLDVADATVSTATGPARDQVLVRHPLQPFDPRNFTPGALVKDKTWSFDRVTLDGARASTAPRSGRRAFLTGPLPPLPNDSFELEDLLRFVSLPVKAFLRRRLSVGLGDYSDELEDDLRVELDGLERWDVGQKILDARLAGIDGRSAWLAAIARGDLPPGELGRPVLTNVYAMADGILAAVTGLIDGPRQPIDVHIELSDSRTLTGTVPDVSGETLISGSYSRLVAKHRIAAWVRLLVLTLAAPERAFTAVTVGRAGGDDVAIQRIRPLGDTAGERHEVAGEKLKAVLDLYERGMREPLPLYCASSAAYAEASTSGADPVAAAHKAWTTGFKFDGEDAEPEHQLVHGGTVTLDQLMREPPGATEHGAGWDPSETTRFGRLAHRMWDGLLEFEALS